ncbi:ParB/RepB/Spo0J family partition protein [Nocardia higoensis]|uniref:ParB/RepB/Spo0J family partition protein n=1 Tax=Nocardia higoensis TaxID=228599 RepID=A0ABS0DGR7_9NOCA|nr:ParB/RepB/Spo0J family partition protein [Nocardia higoensis]MBF6356762.1 ParB/RepB/Spo0J family partition protein [Nocardia higoensis]
MSQAKKGGLGRGLAALIPTGPETVPNGLGTIPAGTGTVPSGPAPVRPAPARPASNGSATKALGVTPNGLGVAAANVIIGLDPADAQASSPLPDTIDRNADGDLVLSAGAVYREIPPDQIEPNPKQPRQVFEDEALAELVHSIREFGLMQPIVVRRLEPGVDRFQLVMGERRWRACQEAGLETIPSIVRETADDSMLRDALLENIHRVQLNPLEEAAAYQQLLEEFGVTHEELATRIGRSRPVVTNMIRLLKLPIPVQRRVAANVLSAGHARALLGLEGGAEAQEALAARIVAEGMSVRATEEAVTLANRDPDAATAPPAPKRKPIHMPGLQDVAEQLSNSFDTRVTVSLGKRKGKIVVEFGSVEDLERIVALMQQQQELQL